MVIVLQLSLPRDSYRGTDGATILSTYFEGPHNAPDEPLQCKVTVSDLAIKDNFNSKQTTAYTLPYRSSKLI